jgi:hypothetical protein
MSSRFPLIGFVTDGVGAEIEEIKIPTLAKTARMGHPRFFPFRIEVPTINRSYAPFDSGHSGFKLRVPHPSLFS